MKNIYIRSIAAIIIAGTVQVSMAMSASIINPTKFTVVNTSGGNVVRQSQTGGTFVDSCSTIIGNGATCMIYNEDNYQKIRIMSASNPSNYCTVTSSQFSVTGVSNNGMSCNKTGDDSVNI